MPEPTSVTNPDQDQGGSGGNTITVLCHDEAEETYEERRALQLAIQALGERHGIDCRCHFFGGLDAPDFFSTLIDVVRLADTCVLMPCQPAQLPERLPKLVERTTRLADSPPPNQLVLAALPGNHPLMSTVRQLLGEAAANRSLQLVIEPDPRSVDDGTKQES